MELHREHVHYSLKSHQHPSTGWLCLGNRRDGWHRRCHLGGGLRSGNRPMEFDRQHVHRASGSCGCFAQQRQGARRRRSQRPAQYLPRERRALRSSTGTWTPTGSLQMGRDFFTLTLLSDGRVLAAAGQNKGKFLQESEIYDSATGVWTVTGSLWLGRREHTATLLPDGRVLVAGGLDGRRATTSAELYDPSTGLWTATAPLPAPREGHCATLLDGTVVLTGDVSTNAPNTWALYDIATSTWTAGRVNGYHSSSTATLLNDDTILVAGSSSKRRASSEIGMQTP